MPMQQQERTAPAERSLAGRTALVTGAGRGVGRAIAEQLAARGGQVVLVARSSDQIEEVADTITGRGGTARALSADLGSADGRRALVGTLNEGSPIDVLVNDAATVDPLSPTDRLDEQGLDAALQVNVVAPVMLAARLLPAMVERGWGRIVNLSSGVVATPWGMVGANAYVTTKAAIEGHTLNLAAELRGTGVTANVYRPGLVDTGMQQSIRDRDPEDIGARMHAWFVSLRENGSLSSPASSAAGLVSRLASDGNGEIWEPSSRDSDAR